MYPSSRMKGPDISNTCSLHVESVTCFTVVVGPSVVGEGLVGGARVAPVPTIIILIGRSFRERSG